MTIRYQSSVVVAALVLTAGLPAADVHAGCPLAATAPVAIANFPVSEWQTYSQSGMSCVTVESFLGRQHGQTAATAGVSSGTAQGYVPKTKDDNTPWRFDMNQNGRRMTAEEFDAWMKAKGIRVATGKPAGEAAVAQPATCTPTAEAAC